MKLYIKEKVFSWGDKFTVKMSMEMTNIWFREKFLPSIVSKVLGGK